MKSLPDPEKLKTSQALVGCENLILDKEARTVRLAKKGMKLDLGGIAKGYAADQAYEVLKREGHPIALITAGGDVRAGDPPPDRQGWVTAIAPLDPESKQFAAKLLMANSAVSTSGDAYQFVEIDGVRYSHIIDPRPGLALTTRSGVSVVAPDATTSDSIATAASVLGPDRGIAWIESMNNDRLAALFLVAEDKGEDQTVRKLASKRFIKLPKAD